MKKGALLSSFFLPASLVSLLMYDCFVARRFHSHTFRNQISGRRATSPRCASIDWYLTLAAAFIQP